MKDFRHVLRGHFIEEFENVYTYALLNIGKERDKYALFIGFDCNSKIYHRNVIFE